MLDSSVSVIVPAYRAAGTIRRAIDSALQQTRPPEEILIVDDGSPDDLAAALTGYSPQVRLVRKSNGGAASARNFGIDHAQGNVIAFLDADDHWEPTKLQRQLAVFEMHPEVGLVASRYYEELPGTPRSSPGAVSDTLAGRPLMAGQEGLSTIIPRIWTTTVIVRREVLGEHRFEPGLEPAEDRDMWIRLASAAPVYIHPERLATAVLEPGSLSRSNVDQDRTNMLRVIDRHGHRFRPAERRDWETRVYRMWAADYLGRNQPARAIRPAWNRLRRQPTSIEGWYVLLRSAWLASRSAS
jgi:glycosyltransferase involved in cell wall biosynthesis